jgi:hypothetical protein
MRRAGIIAAGVVAAFLGGCRSTPPPPPAPEPVPERRPEDFVLSATVMTPRDVEGVRLPRSLRPARYIVEADGVLRAAVGAGSTTMTFPAQTRQLTPAQFEGLWRQMRESGLLDAANPSRIEGPEEAVASREHTTALIYASYLGRRRTLRVLLDRGSAEALAAERLVDRLAELAWIRE